VAQHEIEIIARPEQNFFRRSDNYRFAVAGIPAHTIPAGSPTGSQSRMPGIGSMGALPTPHFSLLFPLSSAGDHMTAVIEAATRAVHLLSPGPRRVEAGGTAVALRAPRFAGLPGQRWPSNPEGVVSSWPNQSSTPTGLRRTGSDKVGVGAAPHRLPPKPLEQPSMIQRDPALDSGLRSDGSGSGPPARGCPSRGGTSGVAPLRSPCKVSSNADRSPDRAVSVLLLLG